VIKLSVNDLIDRLYNCPAGVAGWSQFEDICSDILQFVFVPPLWGPRRQARSYSGIDRRDAIFANRTFDAINNWGRLYTELGARLILVEFKNYDAQEIGKEEVNQTFNYLTEAMGRLALLCCNKKPDANAFIARNNLFSQHNHPVILFLWKDHLKEMLYIKQREEEPSDLIMDLLEEFYLQHE
jgi:hypothetical protein